MKIIWTRPSVLVLRLFFLPYLRDFRSLALALQTSSFISPLNNDTLEAFGFFRQLGKCQVWIPSATSELFLFPFYLLFWLLWHRGPPLQTVRRIRLVKTFLESPGRAFWGVGRSLPSTFFPFLFEKPVCIIEGEKETLNKLWPRGKTGPPGPPFK